MSSLANLLSSPSKCEHNARDGQCARCNLNDAFALDDDDVFSPATIHKSYDTPVTFVIVLSVESPDVMPSPTSSTASTASTTVDRHISTDSTTTTVEVAEEADEETKSGRRTPTKEMDVGGPMSRNNSDVTPTLPAALSGQSSLLRLFKSDMMTVHMVIQYLFKAKEAGVLQFLGNRLFEYSNEQVDNYTPQLINMYLNIREIGEAIHPYIKKRCRQSVDYSLQCAWLLDASGVGNYGGGGKHKSLGYKLRNAILNEELTPSNDKSSIASVAPPASVKKSHHRSHSDATVYNAGTGEVVEAPPRNPPPTMFKSISTRSSAAKTSQGDLTSGRAFRSSCSCQVQACQCPSTVSISAERAFIHSLMFIATRLMALPPDREQRSHRLMAELAMLNLNLPARVWLPLYTGDKEVGAHYVLRVPHTAACLLNSKDKAPYCCFIEILTVDDVHTSVLPPKLCEASTAKTSASHANIHLGLGVPVFGDADPQIRACRSQDNLTTMMTTSYEENHQSIGFGGGAPMFDTLSQMSIDDSDTSSYVHDCRLQ